MDRSFPAINETARGKVATDAFVFLSLCHLPK
jgi:hypothetical protein